MCYSGCCWFNHSYFGEAQLKKCFCLEGLSHVLFSKFYPSSKPSSAVTAVIPHFSPRKECACHLSHTSLFLLHICVLFNFTCCLVNFLGESSLYSTLPVLMQLNNIQYIYLKERMRTVYCLLVV